MNITPYKDDPNHAPAGFWLRFLAYCLDAAIIQLISQGFLFLLTLSGAASSILVGSIGQKYFGADEIFSTSANSAIPAMGGVLGGLFLALFAGMVVVVIFLMFYGACFESSKLQATPGKLFLGLIVTDIYSCRVSFVRALVRNISKFFSYLTMGIGFLMAAIPPYKRTLHDRLAGATILRTGKVSAGRIIAAIVMIIVISQITSQKKQGFEHNSKLPSITFHSNQSNFTATTNYNSKPPKQQNTAEDRDTARDIVRYKDSMGVIHYASDISKVPEQYRDHVEKNLNLPQIKRYSNFSVRELDMND